MTVPDRAGVVVRPPLLYLGALAAGLVADWLWPLPGIWLSPAIRIAAGVCLFGVGIAIVSPAFISFHRAGTNVPTDRPTTALVTGGPYRYSRNPIYIALTAAYLGLAVAFNSLWAVVLVAPVLMVMRHGVVAREEAYLERKFGEPYRAYKGRVRRWI